LDFKVVHITNDFRHADADDEHESTETDEDEEIDSDSDGDEDDGDDRNVEHHADRLTIMDRVRRLVDRLRAVAQSRSRAMLSQQQISHHEAAAYNDDAARRQQIYNNVSSLAVASTNATTSTVRNETNKDNEIQHEDEDEPIQLTALGEVRHGMSMLRSPICSQALYRPTCVGSNHARRRTTFNFDLVINLFYTFFRQRL
jgi:hypothetical protein